MDEAKVNEIVERIKRTNWDVRVQRPGFLQTKALVIEGEAKIVHLTDTHSIQQKNALWANSARPYDQGTVDELLKDVFGPAFAYDPKWPEAVVAKFADFTQRKDALVETAQSTKWEAAPLKEKQAFFEAYRTLVQDITQYYVIAVPLTSYCEKELEKVSPDRVTEYAVPYTPLDIDELHVSLREIQKTQKAGGDVAEAISKHIEKFAWVKTAYNVIQPYTSADVLRELASELPEPKHLAIPEDSSKPYIVGLQVGIYLRNRMKEMSQQLWFASEPWIRGTAADFDLGRDEFLYVLPSELQESFEKGTVTVGKDELARRQTGFIFGIVDGEKVLITGPRVAEVYSFLTAVEVTDSLEIVGRTACRGFVKGLARIIKTQAEFSKLQPGEILVAPMTTPDYVILMKQAGAVVTDEGGLSCHAAIVSRELRIPCVIGTKVATKVLHDGDLVEVDADKGVVRIIERV